MANPNPEIWGAPETWIYSPHTTLGLTSTLSQTIHADRPKTANFGAGATQGYEGSLLRAINVSQKMTLNDFIDNSICPCGQAPEVSPFAKIAIFNENDDLSLIPRVVTITDNINWFFADKASASITNNAFNYLKQYTKQGSTTEGLKFQQFAPKANSPASSYNINMQMCPYTYYGMRSLLLSIEVHCMPKTATNPINQSTWRTLNEWKTQYSETDNIIGLRLYVRTCQTINTSTLRLTYSTDKAISSGEQSYVCVINPITINNDGINTPTQMLNIFNKGDRSAYIFDLTDTIYNWNNGTDNRTNRAVLPCWNYFENQTVHTYYGIPSDPVRYYYYKIPYSDATYDKIMKIAACFGCYFTPTNKYQFDYDMLDNDLYLSVLDENGVAHGQYTHDVDNANNSLYSKSSIREIDYDPSKPPTPVDQNTYSNTTGFNYITEGAAMTVRYVLDGANVDKLLSDLWTINATIAQGGDFEYFDGKIKDEYLTTNPIDCIVSLIRYPFNIPYQIQPLQSYVKLGKTEGSAKGWTTIYIANQINFQGIDIFPRFGDCFLDYEPYTTYELYVPFCGTTKIRAADILGHTLNLTMLIDLITGSCTAYVKADQLVIETLQGSCGVQQQISGTDTATMNANIYNGILAQKQAKVGLIAQGASAFSPSNWVNPVGYAAKGEQAEASYKQATYAIEHIETPVHSQGAASPLLGWIQEFDARLMIYYPEGDVIDGAIPPSFKPTPLAAFGHLKGFATATPGIVSNFQMSGKAAYLSGDIIPDGIPCTLSERNRIKAMFADGVYLPSL